MNSGLCVTVTRGIGGTVWADFEDSEVNLFKVLRSKLKIEDEQILASHPDFEYYLKQYITSGSYLAIHEVLLYIQTLRKFELKSTVYDETLLNSRGGIR